MIVVEAKVWIMARTDEQADAALQDIAALGNVHPVVVTIIEASRELADQ